MTPSPLPHRAVVTVTGWAVPACQGVLVGGLFVRTSGRPQGETRVTVRASLCVSLSIAPDGTLRDLFAFPREARPAGGKNGSSVTVTGQLLRLDRGEGVIRVNVCPAQASDPPFVVTLHATGQVLELDPATFHVTALGLVLRAEPVTPVYASVPERWHRWRPRRTLPRPFALDLPDEPAPVTLAS